MFERPIIVGARELKTVDGRANGRRFRRPEFSVLQIEIVHDLREFRDGRVTDIEPCLERFKSAMIALVTKPRAEHVEWHRVGWRRFDISEETESGGGIDEPPYQPRRCHAINAWTRACHPQTPRVILRAAVVGLLRLALPVTSAGSRFEPANSETDAITAGAAEEVDPLDGREALAVTREIAPPARRSLP